MYKTAVLNDVYSTNVNVLAVCQAKDITHSTTVHIVSIFALKHKLLTLNQVLYSMTNVKFRLAI